MGFILEEQAYKPRKIRGGHFRGNRKKRRNLDAYLYVC